jgi:glutaminase
VIRQVARDSDGFEAAILDVSRLDNINDPARELLAGMTEELRSAGKQGFLVDPDGAVVRNRLDYDAIRYANVEDALAAAQRWLRAGLRG